MHELTIVTFSSFVIRYSDHWRFVIQRLAFLASLLVYLESDSLATRLAVTQLLGGRSSLHVMPHCFSLAKLTFDTVLNGYTDT